MKEKERKKKKEKKERWISMSALVAPYCRHCHRVYLSRCHCKDSRTTPFKFPPRTPSPPPPPSPPTLYPHAYPLVWGRKHHQIRHIKFLSVDQLMEKTFSQVGGGESSLACANPAHYQKINKYSAGA